MIDDNSIDGEVYYDVPLNRFRTIRGTTQHGYRVGRAARWYSDAKTAVPAMDEVLSSEYVAKNLVPVGALDTFPFAEHDPRIDAWRVKADEPRNEVAAEGSTTSLMVIFDGGAR